MTKAAETDLKPLKEIASSKFDSLKKPQKNLVCDRCGKPYKKLAYLTAHVKKCKGVKPDARGGVRPGAGRKPGERDPEVVEREEKMIVRRVSVSEQKLTMQETIAARTHQLIAHQLNMAIGNAQLYVRVKREEPVPKHRGKKDDDEDGEPKTRTRFDVFRVNDEAEFMTYLSLPHDPITGAAKDPDTGSEYYYLPGKGGSYYALANLLDRAFGKPKESVELGEDPEQPLTPIEGGTAALRKSFRDHIMEITKAKPPEGK